MTTINVAVAALATWCTHVSSVVPPLKVKMCVWWKERGNKYRTD